MGGIKLKAKLQESTKRHGDWFLGINNCADYQPVFTIALPELPTTGWKDEGKFGSCWTMIRQPSKAELDQLRELIDVLSTTLLVRRSESLTGHFTDELTYCVALDFNFRDAQEHEYTPVGELEYRAKYKSDAKSLAELGHQVADTARNNPLLRMSHLVAAVPSTSPVAQTLAATVADELGVATCAVTKTTKAVMKELKFEEKVTALIDAYSVNPVVKGKTILLVDDLFQSGASIWALARAMKMAGATQVFGLVGVKSLGDKDNT